MNDPIRNVFSQAWQAVSDPCPRCPSDDDLAAWFDGALPATQTREIEDHALVCAAGRAMVAAVAQALTSLETAPNPFVHIAAAIKGRGLALLNAAELTLRELTSGGAPAPALGALRGGVAREGQVSIQGPGSGLDALDLQVQPDGTLRLTVSGLLPKGPEGELSSVLLEADGMPREKRPYSGEPVVLGPLERGACYRVAVVARRPGQELRSLGEALVDLSAN